MERTRIRNRKRSRPVGNHVDIELRSDIDAVQNDPLLESVQLFRVFHEIGKITDGVVLAHTACAQNMD